MNFGSFMEATRTLERMIQEHGGEVANTRELVDVHYTVDNPHLHDLSPHQPWAEVEFKDRISLEPRNPGNSWKELPGVWIPMKEKDGRYSYTYSERVAYQLIEILEELRSNSSSREAYLAIWNPALDPFRLSRRRVPCTLGYQFFFREGKLHMTYLQRSCNFPKHYQDDVYLAYKLQLWVAEKLGLTTGSFSHWVGSLHEFVREVT